MILQDYRIPRLKQASYSDYISGDETAEIYYDYVRAVGVFPMFGDEQRCMVSCSCGRYNFETISMFSQMHAITHLSRAHPEGGVVVVGNNIVYVYNID